MAKMMKILMALVATVAIAELAMATNYTVGAPNGTWDLQTNLTQWVESKTFHPGDVLIFSYDASQHDVLEVTQANYDSCSTSSPISTHNDGNTAITLSAVGTRYFVCGFTGHCSAGQKVAINVVSGSSTSPAPSSGPTPPSTPGSSSPSPSSGEPSPSTPGSTSPAPGGSTPESSATIVTAGAGLVVGLVALLAF